MSANGRLMKNLLAPNLETIMSQFLALPSRLRIPVRLNHQHEEDGPLTNL
jgi:hypothetical protein